MGPSSSNSLQKTPTDKPVPPLLSRDPDQLYYLYDPVNDKDVERVCCPDTLDPTNMDLDDADNAQEIGAQCMHNTFMNHPRFNTGNPAFQHAMCTLVANATVHSSESPLHEAEQTLIGKVRPTIVNGQQVVDAAQFDIPVRRKKLQIDSPSAMAQSIDAAVDGGSSIEAIIAQWLADTVGI